MNGFQDIGRGAWRRLRGAVGASAAPALDLDAAPPSLLTAPPNLRAGDPALGRDLRAGRFVFGGQTHEVGAPEALWSKGASEDGRFGEWLRSFSWLDDLIAVEDADDEAATLDIARAHVDAWIAHHTEIEGKTRDIERQARRILSWLGAGAGLFGGDGGPLRLNALLHQAQLLDAARLPTEGPERLTRALALACVGACLSDQELLLERALAACEEEAGRQILPDGGHITRNPEALVRFLTDAHALAGALDARGLSAPDALMRAVRRARPMVRFFEQLDGGLACFHGGGEGDRALIARALGDDGETGRTFGYAPHSGFHRVSADDGVLIMDVGAPAAGAWARDAHASSLAFEFATRSGRLIVNCGWSPELPARLREPVRATAAHSALVLDDSSSVRFDERGKKDAARARVDARRNEEELGVWIEGVQEGYRAEFGLAHRRRLFLSSKGDDLRGEDTLFRHVEDSPADPPRKIPYAVRFHLHPAVRVSLARDRRSAHLSLPDGEGWRFKTDCGPIAVERSIYLGAGQSAAETRQLVVTGDAQTDKPIDRPPNRVRWALKRLGRTPVF